MVMVKVILWLKSFGLSVMEIKPDLHLTLRLETIKAKD